MSNVESNNWHTDQQGSWAHARGGLGLPPAFCAHVCCNHSRMNGHKSESFLRCHIRRPTQRHCSKDPVLSQIRFHCLNWGSKLTATSCIGDVKMLVKTQMQPTLAKQYQHRLAKGPQQLTHVECGLRGFVAEAGWQVLGLILLPFCKLHGLTITHNMGCFADFSPVDSLLSHSQHYPCRVL